MNTLLKPLYDYLRDLAPEATTAKEAAYDLGVSPTKIRAAAEELAKMGLANARAVGATFRISAVAGAEIPAGWQSEKVHLVTKAGTKSALKAENEAETAPNRAPEDENSTKGETGTEAGQPAAASTAMPSENPPAQEAGNPLAGAPFEPAEDGLYRVTENTEYLGESGGRAFLPKGVLLPESAAVAVAQSLAAQRKQEAERLIAAAIRTSELKAKAVKASAKAKTACAAEETATPSEKPAAQAEKPAKRKPFTPNPTRGYEVQKGKVKIFLDRKAHSRVLTLSIEDLEELVNAVKKSA